MSISDTLEDIGLKTIGGKITFGKLTKEAPLPSIIHWDNNHFVVLYKAEKNVLHIADPDKGLLKVSETEFKENRYCDEIQINYIIFN